MQNYYAPVLESNPAYAIGRHYIPVGGDLKLRLLSNQETWPVKCAAPLANLDEALAEHPNTFLHLGGIVAAVRDDGGNSIASVDLATVQGKHAVRVFLFWVGFHSGLGFRLGLNPNLRNS